MSDKGIAIGMTCFLVLVLVFMVSMTIATFRDNGDMVYALVSTVLILGVAYAVFSFIRSHIREWRGEEE